jgi:hypothetical protein
MPRKPVATVKKIAAIQPQVTAAELRKLVVAYAKLPESELQSDLDKARHMLFSGKQTPTKDELLTPPAGLRARQAIPVIVAYVEEQTGRDISLSKNERGSLAALASALDREFGKGFTRDVIKKLNEMPNGSSSMHYRR